jgi:hypothetical protein
MNPNGRYKARTREDLLIAMYRLVHARMVCHETTNVSKVCRQIFAELPRDIDIIKVYEIVDRNGKPDRSLFDICRNSENLRKRFYDAKRAAKDKESFPHLSQIVERLESLLPSLIEQHRTEREFMMFEIKSGRAYRYFNSESQKKAHEAKHHKPL